MEEAGEIEWTCFASGHPVKWGLAMATQQMNPTMGDMPWGIVTMDFSKVKLKLMDTEDGEG